MHVIVAASAVLAVVSFKDAAKIKSWDAWGDGGKTPTERRVFKERRSVTREKLLKMDSGLEPWGWLETRAAKALKEIDPKLEITCCVHATQNGYYVSEYRGYGTVVGAPDALELWDNIGRNYKRVCHKKLKG